MSAEASPFRAPAITPAPDSRRDNLDPSVMSLDRRSPAIQSFALTLLRVGAGLVVAQHGLQKLFGMFAAPNQPGKAAAMFSLMWFVGVLETVGGGILVSSGFLTRPIAFLLSGEMAVAYFWKHYPNSFFPVVNRGEPAVLLCWIFFFFAMNGAGRWSVDGMLGRERERRAEENSRR